MRIIHCPGNAILTWCYCTLPTQATTRVSRSHHPVRENKDHTFYVIVIIVYGLFSLYPSIAVHWKLPKTLPSANGLVVDDMLMKMMWDFNEVNNIQDLVQQLANNSIRSGDLVFTRPHIYNKRVLFT